MKRLEKALLRKQADVYIAWGRRNGQVPHAYEGWLNLFVNTSERSDIADVTGDDVQSYMNKAWEVSRVGKDRNDSRKAIEGFMRYYGARKKNGDRHAERGRPPHISEIERVQLYRKMGLKAKEIELLTGKKLGTLYKWFGYKVEK